jgi:hypothetical protein
LEIKQASLFGLVGKIKTTGKQDNYNTGQKAKLPGWLYPEILRKYIK